jgi:hypothetical protein
MNSIFCLLLAAAPGDMEGRWADLFFGLDQEQRFVLLIIAIGCATGIIISTVGIISGTMSTVHRRRLEADMKREMLDRGLPADEITRIVESSPPKDALDRWIACWGKKK